MSEIWNLSTLCRCCHADGHFKSLALPYQGENNVEIYENMLRDILGISMSRTSLSYTICDNCILNLRDAATFKNQVLMCEQKFQVYLNNEQFVTNPDIVKIEQDDDDNNENNDNDFNNECSIEVDIKHPIEDIKEENQPNNEIIVETPPHEVKTNQKSDAPKNVKKEKQKFNKNTKGQNQLNNEIVEKMPNEVKTDTKSKVKKATKNNGIRKKQNSAENPKKKKKPVNVDPSLYSLITDAGNTGSKYSCNQCGECCQNKTDITRHIKTTHPDVYKCEYCSRELKGQFRYKLHIKTHHESIFQCDICSKQFKRKLIIIRHLRVHAGTNKTKLCDLCGRSFNDKSNLNAHINTVHKRLRPYHCKICNKFYSSKKILREHFRIHNGKVKTYKCDVCNHILTCPKSMEVHKLKHDGKYMCRHCSEVFDDVTSRKQHLVTRHNVRGEHSCPICGKVLHDKYCLNRHMNLHQGAKKFPCDICGSKFTQKASLNRHITRKHNVKLDSDIGKTKCDICNYSFRNILLHMACHKNRSSECDICGKTYPDNSSLNRHRLTKHFGRTFDCDICGKKYIYNSKLQTHKMKVHQIKIEKDNSEGS